MAPAVTAKSQRPAARRTPRPRPWTDAHVRRLLWRAGFGPLPGQVAELRRAGRSASLDLVLAGDGDTRLRGPAPTVAGKPIDPENEFDHDVLWWLDRMVRTTHPLEERMTLFWHDHFATADQVTPLLLQQNRTLRRHALGRFDDLLRAMFLDPALQLHLSVVNSEKSDPNENFARELFELYTLGVGNRYTEDDVREAARAFTGWVSFRTSRPGVLGTRFEPTRWDPGEKTIFGQRGPWGWEDVLRITLAQKGVAEFLTDKLWAELVGTPLAARTRRSLVRQFQRSGRSTRTLVAAMLRAPQLYEELRRPDLVKSPLVFVAGLLRTGGHPVDRVDWARLLTLMGQRPFQPPSVAGWDGGPAWCSTTAFTTRFAVAGQLLADRTGLDPVRQGSVDPGLDASGHLALAKRALADPFTTATTDRHLRALAARLLQTPGSDDAARRRTAETVQRALRTLLIAGPDQQLL